MYYGEQEVDKIESNLVTFKDGTTKELNKKEQSYLITETEKDDSAFAELYEFKMIEQIFDVIKNSDILKSFSSDEKVRDQNNVDVTAEVIKRMSEYNFQISKLPNIFHYIISYFGMIQTLTTNNTKVIEEDILIKALGIENLGNTNTERLHNITFNTYAKFINK